MDNVPALNPAACVIVQNDKGEYLLLQRKRDGFCLPGGKIEGTETIIDGAMRELYEETHIDVNLNSYDHFVGVVRSALSDRVVYIFKHVHNGPVVLSDEHVAYIWTRRPLEGLILAGNTDRMLRLDICGKIQVEYYSPKHKQVIYTNGMVRYKAEIKKDTTLFNLSPIDMSDATIPVPMGELDDFVGYYYNFKSYQDLVEYPFTQLF